MVNLVKKYSLQIFGLMALIGGLGAALMLSTEQQDIREKASESDVSQKSLVETGKEIGETEGKKLIAYTSPKYGYSITFDSSFWTELNGVLAETSDLNELSFKLSENLGRATIYFTVFDLPEPNYTLEELWTYIETTEKSRLPRTIKLTSNEKVNKAGSEVLKFNYEESLLGSKSEFYKYFFIKGDYYFEIKAKYAFVGASKDLAEGLIDSFISDTLETTKGLFDVAVPQNTPLDEAKIVELASPSVVNILNVYCTKLKLVSTEGIRFIKPSYDYCVGVKGSGFIVSSIGHIGTNGHVAKMYPEGSLVTGVMFGGTAGLRQFLVDLVREYMYLTGIEISEADIAREIELKLATPEGVNAVLQSFYTLLQAKAISIEDGSSKYYIKLGEDPFSIDEELVKQGKLFEAVKSTEGVLEAELVGFDYPNILSVESVLKNELPPGTDVAILKAKSDKKLSFPALKLGEPGDLKSGSHILVIGYPGLVEGSKSQSSLISYQSSAEPSVTRGIVSSIKTDQDGNDLIQTDASIDHGNSGGPAFDDKGNIIGIATYGFGSNTGNFNFLRSIDDLKELADHDDIKISQGQTYSEWSDALSYFWNGYYRRSLRLFKSVKSEYPIHPTVASFIKDAEEAIAKGQDKEGILGSLNEIVPSRVLIVVFLVILGVGLGGFFKVFKKRRSKKFAITA